MTVSMADRDLQLGDKKVTLNRLVYGHYIFFPNSTAKFRSRYSTRADGIDAWPQFQHASTAGSNDSHFLVGI